MPLRATLKLHLPELLSAILGIWFMQRQWFFIHPQDIAFTDIAIKWGTAHYKEAVNAFWSPLYSWLLLPFMRIIGHPHISIRLLQFSLFLIGLNIWKKWIGSMAHPENQSSTFMRLLGGFNLAFYSQSVAGADFLACLLVMAFCRKLIFQKMSIFAAGFWLAILYYTSEKLLFFGLGAVTAAAVYQWVGHQWQISRLKTALRLFISTSLAALFILPWVNAMHIKYGNWMTGSSTKYQSVYRYAGGIEHAWKEHGLLPPPDQFSTFAWTDMTQHTKDFRHLIHQNHKSVTAVVSYNLLKTARLLIYHATAGLIAVFLLLRGRKTLPAAMKSSLLLAFILAVLYITPMQFLAVESGLLLPLFMVLSTLVVNLPAALFPIKNGYLYFLVLALLTLPGTLTGLTRHRNNLQEHHLANALVGIIPKGANIATFQTGQTWALSFYNRYRDYGGIQGERNELLAEDLKSCDIRYVVVPYHNLAQTEKQLHHIQHTKIAVEAGNWFVLKLN